MKITYNSEKDLFEVPLGTVLLMQNVFTCIVEIYNTDSFKQLLYALSDAAKSPESQDGRVFCNITDESLNCIKNAVDSMIPVLEHTLTDKGKLAKVISWKCNQAITYKWHLSIRDAVRMKANAEAEIPSVIEPVKEAEPDTHTDKADSVVFFMIVGAVIGAIAMTAITKVW